MVASSDDNESSYVDRLEATHDPRVSVRGTFCVSLDQCTYDMTVQVRMYFFRGPIFLHAPTRANLTNFVMLHLAKNQNEQTKKFLESRPESRSDSLTIHDQLSNAKLFKTNNIMICDC